MTKTRSLSATKISTYLACPTRYVWTYVDPRGKFYLKSKKAFSFGTSLHKVLEDFYKGEGIGVETRDQVAAALEESWIDSGYHTPEEMAEAYGEGLEILEKHVEDAISFPPTSKTICVEKSFKLDLPNVQLVGRVDRIDELEDGTLEIIDYKSGRRALTPEDVRGDLAMSLYQLLVARSNPGKDVCATILALRTNERATAALTPAELDQLELDLNELAPNILELSAGVAKPIFKRLCSTCDFKPLCRRHPSFVASESQA